MSNMMRRTAVAREAAQIRDETESAYVKMFTTDMVTLHACVRAQGINFTAIYRGAGKFDGELNLAVFAYNCQVCQYFLHAYNNDTVLDCQI